MSNPFNRNTSSRAFTLLEMIIVIAILALVSGAIGSILQYFYKTNDYIIQEGDAVQAARTGITTAMENLREASYGDDGSYPIASAATSSVYFYADVNNDGDVEKVRYYLSGSTLYRGVTESTGNPPSYNGQPETTDILATDIVNGTSTPIFQYTDANGNALSQPVNVASVASITTTLKIDVDPKRAPGVYTLIGSATLRNLND